MLIAIDIGNSSIAAGVFAKAEEPLCTFAISAKEPRAADEYLHLLRSSLEEREIDLKEIKDGAIASVVPMLTPSFEQALEKLCGKRPMVLGAGVKTGISIRTDSPAEVGADIIANAAAAAKGERGTVLVDFGTATTIFALSEKRELLGGAILPGISASMESLRYSTAQLPMVPLGAKKDPLGKNTADCISNGVVLGHAFSVDGFGRAYQALLGGDAALIATGGLAPLILPHCSLPFKEDQNLTLKGLREIYEKTRKIKVS